MPAPNTWWGDRMEILDQILDDVQYTYPVDPDRIYLTGLSMGGYALALCRAPSPALCRSGAHLRRRHQVERLPGGGQGHQRRARLGLPRRRRRYRAPLGIQAAGRSTRSRKKTVTFTSPSTPASNMIPGLRPTVIQTSIAGCSAIPATAQQYQPHKGEQCVPIQSCL